MTPTRRPVPGYIAAAGALMRALRPPKGSLTHFLVTHQDGCGFLAGVGICTCTPDVEVIPEPPRRRAS